MTGGFVSCLRGVVPRNGKINHIGNLADQLDAELTQALGKLEAQKLMYRLRKNLDFQTLQTALRRTTTADVRAENE